jgi:hypothetical protein
MSQPTATEPSATEVAPHPILSRWPAALGVAVAALQLVTGASRDTVTITLVLALLCYLAAAALGRRWIAWAGIPGGALVVLGTELIGLPWWIGVGIVGVALVIIGLVSRVPRPALTAQTIAMAGYGSAAVFTLFLAPQIGLLLAGLLLAGHAVWDVIHYRRNQVVSRSLAEFCVVLDLLLGGGAVIIALIGQPV